MSVKVTYLEKIKTEPGGTFNHTHAISHIDKSVPSEEEFEILSKNVDSAVTAIQNLQKQLSEYDQKLVKQKKEIEELAGNIQTFKCEITQFLQTNLSDGSPFFSNLSKIIQKHIENVQRSVKKLAPLEETVKQQKAEINDIQVTITELKQIQKSGKQNLRLEIANAFSKIKQLFEGAGENNDA